MSARISDLIGKILVYVSPAKQGDDEIIFVTDSGERYMMYHEQDCCESVSIDDVCGDMQDLVGSPILVSEEVSGETPRETSDESCTWTFYKIDTAKGGVTIRWYGESNGYYSERVDFEKVG